MSGSLSVPLGVLMLLVLALPGCAKKRLPADDQGEPAIQQIAQRAADPQPPPPEKRPGGVTGAPSRQRVQNDLRQLAILYKDYQIISPRGATNVKAFADYIRRDARHIAEALDKKVYHLVLRVRPGANTVLAFEVAGDEDGKHIAVMNDGSVQTLKHEQVEQYWKKQGKQ
jgi:hypothetical protein